MGRNWAACVMTLVVVLSAAALSAQPEVLYYKFNEGTGSTTANDANPGQGSNPVTFTPSPTWNTTTAPLGAASRGTGASVATTGTSLSTTASFTIEFWVNNNTTDFGYICGDPTAASFRIFLNGAAGAGNAIFRGGGFTDLICTGASNGVWHHVAYVYDSVAATVTAYLDGTQVGQNVTQTGTGTGGGFFVGNNGASTTSALLGDMDEFRLWSTARTPAEIGANWNVELALGPEMDVVNGATPVADGGTDAQGNIGIMAQQSVTYTIENNGAANLTLTGGTPVVVTAGTNTQGVAVVTQPGTTVTPAGSVQFTVNYTVQAAGAFDFTVSIDNDDSNENPYNWTVSGTGVAAPEINVTRVGTIVSGGTDALGNRTFNKNSNLTYTVQNLGTAVLNITSITISGEVNVTATVTNGLTSVAAAANDTFTIQLNPTAAGAFSFTVTIANDDGDENPYTILVSGTGVKAKKSGGGGDDEGCSTNGGGSSWRVILGLLSMVALATRMRISRE